MVLFHDSRDVIYRRPTGALVCGASVRLRIHASEGCTAVLRLWMDGAETRIPMQHDGGGLFTAYAEMSETPGLVWYYFIVTTPEGDVRYYGNAWDGKGGTGAIYETEPPGYQITVCAADYDTPHWMRDGIMMQIMVDRFRSSGKKDPKGRLRGAGFYHRSWDEPPMIPRDINGRDLGAVDFFGGDLKGLTEKLPYLRDMGVTVLYLNPIFQAASNHKYDTCDYMRIDPSFGTEADFRRLTRKAKKLGMRVLLDGVFNHTGADSRYFNRRGAFRTKGAYQSKESPYYEWYKFNQWPNDYACWWGFTEHPDVNELTPSYLDFIIRGEDSVTAHWMNAGSAGWRLDVADELPMDFLRLLRAREKGIDPDAALLGEVWEDPSNKTAYGELRSYCLGDTLDSAMNYVLRQALIDFLTQTADAHAFKRTVDHLMENLPAPFAYSMMNMLGTHDKPRAINALCGAGNPEPPREMRNADPLHPADYDRGVRRMLAAWKFLCAFPGMPCIYYGDDVGVQGMGDPFCRGTYPWDHGNEHIRAAYMRQIKRRNENPVLRNGFVRLYAPDPDVVVVARHYENGLDAFGNPAEGAPVMLALNRAYQPRSVTVNGKGIIIGGESALWVF